MIVKRIAERDGTALVEWTEDGQAQRAVVPSSAVSEAGECEHPERGLPYGLNFADFISVLVTPEDIDRELKRAGVWTADDVYARPAVVQGAISAAYGAVLQDLLRNVKALRRNS